VPGEWSFVEPEADGEGVGELGLVLDGDGEPGMPATGSRSFAGSDLAASGFAGSERFAAGDDLPSRLVCLGGGLQAASRAMSGRARAMRVMGTPGGWVSLPEWDSSDK
jgi:hypothetical protein